MKKFLIIQTAFLGDVVLATAVAEKLNNFYPTAQIDFLVRSGNESLFENHPFIKKVWVWNKKKEKFKGLFLLRHHLKKERYDYAINLQRFFSTGLLTLLSGAKKTIGFSKNPLSRLFSYRSAHEVSLSNGNDFTHEIARNQKLIEPLTDREVVRPRLYPSEKDFGAIQKWTDELFITIAPASVWFTKQFPLTKWVEFINNCSGNYQIFLLGGPSDVSICQGIKNAANKNVYVLAGELTYLQTCALMKFSQMNYTNDSAPMHFASAMEAPITAIYCSTIPAFGFGPLSPVSQIVQFEDPLYCRPCGLHGYRQCPERHFKCALSIKTSQLLATLPKNINGKV